MRIGIADTMFARGDMGGLAVKTIAEHNPKIKIERYTVPGIKDLPVAAKKLIEERHCDIVLAFGMAGKMPIDQQCAHEASLGIIAVQLLTNKHVLGVFVHEIEAKDDAELKEIMRDRTIKHSLNAISLIARPDSLTQNVGKAKRQGSDDAGYFALD